MLVLRDMNKVYSYFFRAQAAKNVLCLKNLTCFFKVLKSLVLWRILELKQVRIRVSISDGSTFQSTGKFFCESLHSELSDCVIQVVEARLLRICTNDQKVEWTAKGTVGLIYPAGYEENYS